RPSARPTVVVDLPSPAGVGVIAVTSTSAPSGRPAARAIASRPILALKRPYSSKSSPPRPAFSAISWMGRSLTVRAISRSRTPMGSDLPRAVGPEPIAQLALEHLTVSVLGQRVQE